MKRLFNRPRGQRHQKGKTVSKKRGGESRGGKKDQTKDPQGRKKKEAEMPKEGFAKTRLGGSRSGWR